MNKKERFFLRSIRGADVLITILIIILVILVVVFFQNKKYELNDTVSKTVNENITVIIDAGHGGEDGGAVSKKGTLEKDINLSISKKLYSCLISRGFNAIMTRTSDISIYDDELKNADIHKKKVSDIDNRIRIARENPNAVFISIHQNYYGDSAIHGSQVFYNNNEGSQLLAQIMQDRLKNDLNQNSNRASKEISQSVKLMNNIENTSVLVECGFLSNNEDENNLLDDDYQTMLSQSITDSICEYIKISKNGLNNNEGSTKK